MSIEEIIKDWESILSRDPLDVPWDLIDDTLTLLKELEAKTGHWISVNDEDVVELDNDGCPERACYCSECKKYLVASDEYAVYGRYCPHCGAKMTGEVNANG